MERDRRAAQMQLGDEIARMIENSGLKKKHIYESMGRTKKTLDNWIQGVSSPSHLEMLELRYLCAVGKVKEDLRNILDGYGIKFGRSK